MRRGKTDIGESVGLSPEIGGEKVGEFGFKSKDTKLVRKYW